MVNESKMIRTIEMEKTTHVVCPACSSTNRVPGKKLTDGPFCGKCGQKLFSARPLELTKDNFRRHIENNGIPVIVDFWAPWCGPCRAMGPAISQAAAYLEPKARVCKLNTENEEQIAGSLDIRGIPTVIIFNKGREIARRSGAMEIKALLDWINSNI